MRSAPSVAAFVADPVGRHCVAGTTLLWCATPSLGGVATWGAPDADATRKVVEAFAALWSPRLVSPITLVIDGRRIERLDPDALSLLIGWLEGHHEALGRRVLRQVGVISRGLMGLTLAGILPTLGQPYPFRVVETPEEAHRLVESPEGLAARVEALVDEAAGTSGPLRALRELLKRELTLSLPVAARTLGISPRSLQRTLGAHHTSFQRELRDARFSAACALLEGSDEKVSLVARRVGVTEDALVLLFRERAGTTPSEHRARHRR